MSVTDQTQEKMVQTIDHLKTELKNIRTGRANPGIVEGVSIEVYGTQMRLKDLANITTPEPRQLLITPYDAQNAGAIAKSLEKANLGIQPVHDGGVVRINIPSMDESVRNEMVKVCHRKQEECKVSIRNVRRDYNEVVRKQKADGDIPEDMMKKLEKDIQELTDKFCKETDDIAKTKEQEIVTI